MFQCIGFYKPVMFISLYIINTVEHKFSEIIALDEFGYPMFLYN